MLADLAPRRYQNLARQADPLDRVVFATESVIAAKFRCPRGHARFRDSGPTSHYLVTFPRTSVWIKYAGSRSFVADPALSTIYNPGQEFTRSELSSDGDRSDWLAVSPEIALAIAEAFDPLARDHPDRPFGRRVAPVDARLYLAQRKFFTALEQGTVDPLYAEEQIIRFVFAIIRRAYGAGGVRRRKEDDAHRDLAQRTRALIASSVGDRITLTSLAPRLGVSPFHLCRVFHAQMGTTLHAFRVDLRMRLALERLAEPRADLSRIALDLGFSSHSHFTAMMRRRYGDTPTVLRRQLS